MTFPLTQLGYPQMKPLPLGLYTHKTQSIPQLWPCPHSYPCPLHVCTQCSIQGLENYSSYVKGTLQLEPMCAVSLEGKEMGRREATFSSPNPSLMKPGGVGLTGITVAWEEGKGRSCSRHHDHMVLNGQPADAIQAWLLLQSWTHQMVHECLAGRSSLAGMAMFWSLSCPAHVFQSASYPRCLGEPLAKAKGEKGQKVGP